MPLTQFSAQQEWSMPKSHLISYIGNCITTCHPKRYSDKSAWRPVSTGIAGVYRIAYKDEAMLVSLIRRLFQLINLPLHSRRLLPETYAEVEFKSTLQEAIGLGT